MLIVVIIAKSQSRPGRLCHAPLAHRIRTCCYSFVMFLCCIVVVAAVMDPFSLHGNIEGVDLNVELEEKVVDFSSRACLSWLVGPHAVTQAPSLVWWRARDKDIRLLHEMKDMIGKGKPPREGCQGHQKPCLPVAFPWPPQAMQEWRRGRSRTSHASLVGSSPSVRMPSRSCKKSLRRQTPRTFPTP